MVTVRLSASREPPHFGGLFLSFLKIGVVGFGGGLAMIAQVRTLAALSIGRSGIHTSIGVSMAVVAAVVLVRFRPNPFWVIVGADVLRILVGNDSLVKGCARV
jgi:chromate transport protein ChrA